MADIRSFDLVAAVIPDQANDDPARVLLAEGVNYGWELPGAKLHGDADPLDTLHEALRRKLGIWVAPDEHAMPMLGEVEVSMVGIAIKAKIYRVTSYLGIPMETEESGYYRTEWVNPLKLGLGRIGLSPVATQFHKIVSDDPALLVGPWNHVQ